MQARAVSIASTYSYSISSFGSASNGSGVPAPQVYNGYQAPPSAFLQGGSNYQAPAPQPTKKPTFRKTQAQLASEQSTIANQARVLYDGGDKQGAERLIQTLPTSEQGYTRDYVTHGGTVTPVSHALDAGMAVIGAGVLATLPTDATIAGSTLQATKHGAERIAGAAATRGGVLAEQEITTVMNNGRSLTQSDGALVKILTNTNGKSNVVVSSERGIITTFKNLSPKSLDRLSKNYGWK